MNYPCGVSHDELKNDRQETKLETMQREALYEQTRNEYYANFQSDIDCFLMELDKTEKEYLLRNLLDQVMNADPKEDQIEAFHQTANAICDKMYRTAEFLAAEESA